MLLGIQIIGVLFGIFMLYLAFLQKKRKEASIPESILWFIFWGVFIVITILPQILNPITIKLNITRTMDLLIIGGILFMVGISYYNYNQIKHYKIKIESIVTHIAWKETENENAEICNKKGS